MAKPISAVAQDADAAELAELFGARPSVLDISLSPSGDKIAYIAPGPGSSDVLYVADLAGNATPRAINRLDNPSMQLSQCDFATEERLICYIDGISMIDTVLAGYSRVISLAADGSDMTILTARDSFRALGVRQDGGSVIALDVPGKENSVLMTHQYVPETMTGTRLSNQNEGLGVDAVDVDRLLRVGRQRRVVGASYATEKREIVYFDKDLEQLAGQLERALPGHPLITIADASADEQLLLVIASSDTDPGTTYLLDRRTNELSPLLLLREQLEGREMAPMQPVSFPAADGTMIPAYLTMPLGGKATGKAIVMPHGGPSSRDEWGFDWLVQFFVARGYAVLQPNYRGSTGYGAAWFGHNGFQAWNVAVGDVNDAGR